MINLLLVDSSDCKHSFFSKLVGALVGRNFNFTLLAHKNYLYQQFKENNWPVKLNRWGWPGLGRLSRIFLWYYYCLYFLSLFFQKGEQMRAIILLNWPEKIVLTPLARLLGWQAIWIELPGTDYESLPKHWRKLLHQRAQFAKLVALSRPTKQTIVAQGLADENLPVIMPGIELSEYVYQDDIFNNLAEARESAFRENHFTVGTILEQASEQKVEMLLKAMQRCLEFIPAVQLIVIGEFANKKKIDWLVRKMNVPNVWLVGHQINLKKWLNNFDVFVVAETKPSLNNLLATMGAMANKLVVIGQQGSCLDDVIVDQQTGLSIELNSDNLAEQIIELQQNPVLRKMFGKRAQALAGEYFTFSRAVEDFYKLFNNL